MVIEVDFSAFPVDTSGATSNWLNGVSVSGTFHCKPGLEISERGASTVPDGWTVVSDL